MTFSQVSHHLCILNTFWVCLFSFQRSEIVTSAYEPTDEECEWKTDEEEELTVSKQVQVTYTYTPACFICPTSQ